MYKKLLFSLAIIGVLTTKASAQITIDSMDFANVGDTLFQALDSIPSGGILLGNAGTGQVWDFSSLVADELDTIIFRDPATTIYDTIFPNANLVIDPLTLRLGALNPLGLGQVGVMAFVSNVSSQFEVRGVATDGQGLPALPVVFNPTQKWFNFPTSYQDTLIDTTGFDLRIDDIFTGIFDSVRVKRFSTIVSIIDAEGTITTPLGTFNCLRQYKVEINADSIGVRAVGDSIWNFSSGLVAAILGPNPIIDTQRTYNFYADSVGFTLVNLLVDANDNIISASFLVSFVTIMSSTDASCNNSCDGTASAYSTNGTLPYTYAWDDDSLQTTSTATGLCAGTYNVMVIDAAGDTTNTSVIVYEPLALTLVVTSPMPDSGSGDGTALATVTGGTTPITFSWSTSPPQTAGTAVNLTEDTYTVVVTDANGCTITDSVAVILYVGIEKYGEAAGEVLLYPNPTSGTVNIVSTIADVQFFNVYDITGKQVLNMSIKSGSNTLSISDLNDGNYVYQIVNKSGIVIKNGKFSVQK